MSTATPVRTDDGEAAAEVGRVQARRRGVRGRAPGRRRLGRDVAHGPTEPGAEVARDALDAPRVGAVALDREVEDDVRGEPERVDQPVAHALRQPRVEDEQALRGRRQAQLARASRACRWLVTPRITRWRNREPPGQGRAHRGEGHEVADLEVPRAADHLERLGAGVDAHEADLVGAGDRVDAGHARHEDVVEALADDVDALDHQAEVVEGLAQLVDALVEVDELAQPAQRDPHENCLRNRTSFSVSARRSAISWRIWAQRSIPKPKAKPLHSLGVDADRLEHRGVEHPAAAELDPPGLRAGAAARAPADRAGDLELRRRLGEGEVARPQPRRRCRGRSTRRVKVSIVPARSAKVIPRSTTRPSIWWKVDEVARVGRVAPVAAPGHHRVDRQRVMRRPPPPSGGSGSARCGCAARPSRARPGRRRRCPTGRAPGGPAGC